MCDACQLIVSSREDVILEAGANARNLSEKREPPAPRTSGAYKLLCRCARPGHAGLPHAESPLLSRPLMSHSRWGTILAGTLLVSATVVIALWLAAHVIGAKRRYAKATGRGPHLATGRLPWPSSTSAGSANASGTQRGDAAALRRPQQCARQPARRRSPSRKLLARAA